MEPSASIDNTLQITLNTLTFGVEVEMITCYLKPQEESILTQEIIQPKVVEILSSHRFPAQQVEQPYEPNVTKTPDYSK